MLRVVILAAVVILAVPRFSCAHDSECRSKEKTQPTNEPGWTDGFCNLRTVNELVGILSANHVWVESHHAEGKRAELEGADLRRVDLQGKDLREADLSGANLSGSLVGGVFMDRADLRNATLTDAKMAGAMLRGANLGGAEMAKAWLFGADLESAVFEPNSNPDVRGIAGSLHLERIRYQTRPDAMTELRKELGDRGFREAERKVIYAINRTETEQSLFYAKSQWMRCAPRWILSHEDEERRKRIDSILNNPSLTEEQKAPWRNCSMASALYALIAYQFRTVFFDWTCAYGMLPGRALRIIFFLWLVCTVIYYAFARFTTQSAIFKVDIQEETDKSPETKTITRLGAPGTGTKGKRFRRTVGEFRLLCWTAYFSLLNGLRLGFHDFDFGKWLSLLSSCPRDIKSTGWIRTIGGMQSLVTLYLVALWVLTFFGNPFS